MICEPYAGGNWTNGANAGLAALNLNNSRANSNSNIGFRPALDDACCTSLTGLCQCSFQKDAATSALAETVPQPVDASTGCTYEQLYQFNHLLQAAYKCRRGKSAKEVTLRYFAQLEENTVNLQNHLMWQSYQPSPHYQFYVFEPKRRLISAPPFADRVLHRALYDILYPLFDKQFIYDSYACRIGKGAHKGASRAQKYIQQVEAQAGTAYALKADIARYFSSIDHAKLISILRQKIKCQRTLGLLISIIKENPEQCEHKGIPLGNLTSQLFANIYLHELDMFVKHKLKVKRYARYMDDFIIVHSDKAQLHRWRAEIECFLHRNLKLKTNSKTQIFPIAKKNGRPLDFLGYRIYSSHRLLRKCSVNRIKHRLKLFHRQYAAGEITMAEIAQVIESWLAHARHASTKKLTEKLLSQPFIRR